ncbi:eCIS core domain-containing protein [Deinococcus kurensis]|uniref:eCIS core domain-containing protein n=1 Tax=Deinococcus kurensis TaxID=2662757 RepID=UPI0012D2AAD6|nr:DUF4157 domain-containing protein [Deinococcus kurensis]
MTFVHRPTTRKRAQTVAKLPLIPAPSPAEKQRSEARQALARHTARPVAAQRQEVQAPLRAAMLDRQEVQRLQQERQAVQAQLRALPAGSERPPAPAVHSVPAKPATPDEWVTVLRHRAGEIEGQRLDARTFGAFQALQRQVAQQLAQGFRADRSDTSARYASYGEQLATLQRHALSASVARVVLGMVSPVERLPLQRATDEALQRLQAQESAALHFETAQSLQRQLAELDAEATQPVLARIQARRGGGNPLPDAIRRHLERGLNHDLSRVRIHDDAEADKLAKGVNAIAFTTGADIFFRAGHFSPNTQSGLELLAHEVTHTVQQSQGRVATGIDPDAGLEREAQVTGARLASTFTPTAFLSAPRYRAQRVPKVQGPLMPRHAAQRLAPDARTVQRSLWGDWWKTFQNKALEVALESAARIPNGEVIVSAFKRSQTVFQKIFANPGGFFANLFGSVKNGFLLFKGNIATHLKTALVDWLTGTSIAATGGILVFPKSLDGKELLGFGMNVLGLNTSTLVARLSRRYGAANVQKAQGQLAVLQQARSGLHKLNDFRSLDAKAKDGMLSAAQSYAIQTVAQQAVVWVTGFLATGGLGPVAKAAFSLVSTFLQNARTFGQVGKGVLDSVQDIASGQLSAASKKVEQNLAQVTGLVLKFVSKLLGLDKIGGALRKGLAAVQKPINATIDRIVGSKPVQAVFQKLKGAGSTLTSAAGKGLRNIWSAVRSSGPSLTARTSVKGTKHHLWVEIQGERPVVIMASNPLPLREQLAQMEKEAAAFLTGLEKNQVDQVQQDANQMVDKGIEDMLQYIRTRPRNPNPTADEAWLRANTQVIRGELAKKGKALITRVNVRVAPAVALLDRRVLSPDDLDAAIDNAGGIVAFLQALSAGKPGLGVDRAQFTALWGRTTAGKAEHRRLIKERFREAMPGHHEWIPCDLILEVVEREFQSRQLLAPVHWVNFQHLTRSKTQYLVFQKPRVLNGKAVIQGHSGATYFGTRNLQRRITYVGETVGQPTFHNELRAAFRGSTDHASLVTGIRAVMSQHLWDGKRSFGMEIHPQSYWRSDTNQYLNFKQDYAAIGTTITQQYGQIWRAIR